MFFFAGRESHTRIESSQLNSAPGNGVPCLLSLTAGTFLLARSVKACIKIRFIELGGGPFRGSKTPESALNTKETLKSNVGAMGAQVVRRRLSSGKTNAHHESATNFWLPLFRANISESEKEPIK